MKPKRQDIIAIRALCDINENDARLLLNASWNNVFIANIFFHTNGGKIPLETGLLRNPEPKCGYTGPLRLEHLSYADREAGELYGILSSLKPICGVWGTGDGLSFMDACKKARGNNLWLMVYMYTDDEFSKAVEKHFRENEHLGMQVAKYFVIWQTSVEQVTESQLVPISYKPQITIIDPQSMEIVYTIKPHKEFLLTQMTSFLALKKPYRNVVAQDRVKAAETVDAILRTKFDYVPLIMGVQPYYIAVKVHLLDSAGEKDWFAVCWPGDTQVEVLRIFIEDNFPHYAKQSYVLVSGFPFIFIKEGLDKTLTQAGFFPSINLHVHMQSAINL